MKNHNRTLDDVAGSIRNADGQCVVLIGAGCSLSAGIPLANKLIAEIKARYPEAYNRAVSADGTSPSYNEVMEEMSPVDRQKLLNQYIEKAKVNWAHLALAQLFANKKIDRVLTVNFDPLLVKACSMVDFYPAIYDIAGTDRFKSHRIAPQSIFYLNGQHTGFVTLNATDELDAHRKRLTTVVEDTGAKRVWIVVGYSGEADPLLEILAKKECFDGDLYWLGYSAEPSPHLEKSGLLSQQKHAFYVGGQDADKCLTKLAQKLECFPPDILVKPFDHLQKVMKNIDFDTGGEEAAAIKNRLFTKLETAANAENSPAESSIHQAERWMMTGEFTKVIDAFSVIPLTEKSPAMIDLESWAYTMMGVKLNHQASALNNQDPEAAQTLWSQASTKYAQALAIKPDKHEAANNWGVTLDAQAKALNSKDPEAAQMLWEQAYTKYAQALAIKPDMHEAANNWGSALSDQASALNSKDLEDAQTLWSQASAKYAQALAIKPDKHEAANNWGIALNAQASALNSKDPEAAQTLWSQAVELLERHAKLAPLQISYNLACVYSRLKKLDLALDQLEICRVGNDLPSHWQTDDDLANLRATDAYRQWFEKHFPNG